MSKFVIRPIRESAEDQAVINLIEEMQRNITEYDFSYQEEECEYGSTGDMLTLQLERGEVIAYFSTPEGETSGTFKMSSEEFASTEPRTIARQIDSAYYYA